jgi:NAD(P)-dependent dehydrogenase (short-subunit alcohol dehydrogenase family)
MNAERRHMDFTGRVVLVTGASRGLGRDYAADFARRGAAVVVCARRHEEEPSKLDAVVEEVARSGGAVVGVHSDIGTPAGGQAVVDAAVASFGRLDVVVHNAGIVLPDSFADTTIDDLDSQLDVHVRGAFRVTRLAFEIMRDQGYGRFVFTSSPAALLGRAGVAGYTTAKMAVLGMANAVGLEGEEYGVLANSLLPMAPSRMADLVRLAEAERGYLERAAPELVTPMVLYLASEACSVNRRIFWASAGRYAEAFVGLTEGWLAAAASTPDPVDIAAHIDQIACRVGHQEHRTLTAAIDAFMANPRRVAADPRLQPPNDSIID